MSFGAGTPAIPSLRSAAGGGEDALRRAVSALDSRRPSEAERIALDLLRANPAHLRAPHVLGYALLMQGRGQEAIAALEPTARARHDPELDTILAIALRQAGRNDDALRRLKAATKRRPPYATSFHELGCLLASMEHYDESIAAFARGLEVAPMMPELSIQLGHVFLRIRDYPNAKAAFLRALEISPAALEALHGIGKACQLMGEHEPAGGYFRRCILIRPSDTEAWLDLGQSLLALGRRNEGYECFRSAVRTDPNSCGKVLTSLAAAGHGRLWLRRSAAKEFLR